MIFRVFWIFFPRPLLPNKSRVSVGLGVSQGAEFGALSQLALPRHCHFDWSQRDSFIETHTETYAPKKKYEK